MFNPIPTKAQWKTWSLPAKLTCIGTYLGALCLVLAIVFYIWPLGSDSPKIDQTTIGSQSPIVNTKGPVTVTYQGVDTQQVLSRIDTNSAHTEAVVTRQVDSGKQEILALVQQVLFRMDSNSARLETLIRNQGDSNRQEIIALTNNIHQEYARLAGLVKIDQLAPSDQARVTNAIAQANRAAASVIISGNVTIGGNVKIQ